MKKNYASPLSESVEIFFESMLANSNFRTNASSDEVDGSRRSQKKDMWSNDEGKIWK